MQIARCLIKCLFSCAADSPLSTIHDGSMTQKIWSGITATLLIATLGIAPSYANQPKPTEGSQENTSSADSLPDSGASTSTRSVTSSTLTNSTQTGAVLTNSTSAHSTPAHSASADSSTVASPAQPDEAVKVGEYQSQEDIPAEASVATIHPHELAGRQAVTLYVRNIPVLTFLGDGNSASKPQESADAEVSANSDGATAAGSAAAKSANVQLAHSSSGTKVGTLAAQSVGIKAGTLVARSVQAATPSQTGSSRPIANHSADPDPSDPMWRATTIAARLNQLHRDNIDARTITVAWDDQRQDYIIKAGDHAIVEMIPDSTILPKSTRNPAEDALQATNLIRRQLGFAPPLSNITGAPDSDSAQVAVGPVQFTLKGLASWYGPGLDGNYSASGEMFNQNALTAAHRNLPFGTQVRVTNLDNGLSVVVRINDRGPFAADRVIDLSAGAARVIGLVQSGVAPVSLEVLGATRTAAN